MATSVVILARRLQGLVDEPGKVAVTIAGGGTARSSIPALQGIVRAWAPAFVLGLLLPRTRRASALALLVPGLHEWWATGADLDPVRFAALHVVDDVAYGTGVWAGSVTARTMRPLLPRLTLRSRVWSSRTLRSHLGDHGGDESPGPGGPVVSTRGRT
jgi:hypothetical protein